jgi:hypothetical protein
MESKPGILPPESWIASAWKPWGLNMACGLLAAVIITVRLDPNAGSDALQVTDPSLIRILRLWNAEPNWSALVRLLGCSLAFQPRLQPEQPRTCTCRRLGPEKYLATR